MKSRIAKGINIALVLLLWLQLVVGRSTRCSLTRNFVIIYPHDSGAKPGCRPCPICPVGQGVSPQCGSQITNETRIECKQCQANKNYSDSHGIGSCRPCNECGLKNVIQPCTPYQNRICGKDCPKGYFLNDNKDCQAEATSKPTGTKPTSTAVHNMTEEQLKTQSYIKATAPPAKNLSGSEVRATPDLENRKLTTLPPTTANNSAGDEKRKEDEEQTVDQTTFIVVVALVLPFAVIASIVLTFCWLKRSRTESGGAAGETIPLSSRELDSDGSTQVEDVLDKEVAGPNVELIPADRHVSDMESLCDDDNQPMLFYVKRELDPIETVTKKTWRSVGQALIVSSTDLDLIETEYKSGGSPTEILIKKLKTRSKEPTLREFVQALVVCERHDIASYICNWPWEKLQKSKDQPSVVSPDTSLLLE